MNLIFIFSAHHTHYNLLLPIYVVKAWFTIVSNSKQYQSNHIELTIEQVKKLIKMVGIDQHCIKERKTKNCQLFRIHIKHEKFLFGQYI